MTIAPWETGIRLARQHLNAGAPAHLERELQLIYGDDILTDAERRELGFKRAVRKLEAFVAEHGRQPRKGEVVDGFNLGHWVVNRRVERGKGKLSADRVARLEQVPGWTWDLVAASFDDGHARLVAFVAKHGRQPKDREVVDGFPLGKWVADRRSKHRAGKLSADRVDRLESVPGWSWAARAAAFDDGHARLVAFVAEHGRQPKMDEAVDGFPLGKWVVKRRSEHWKGKLSAERIARLEQVPGWSWSVARAAAFEAGHARLVAFVAEHGRQPKDREVVDGFPLGKWMTNRRSEHRAGSLSPDRVTRLESIRGWSWSVARAAAFEAGHARLVAFVAEHGRQPQTREVVDGFPLGQWVVGRRREHRAGTLSPDRVARLESVPGWSWGRPAAGPPA